MRETPDHDETTELQNARVMAWVRIGRANPWIRAATDPPFSARSIHFCPDVDALAERLVQGNWCVGQGFAVGNVCFLNQVDGGDEWLVIRDSLPFESYTFETEAERVQRKNGAGFPARDRLARFLADVTVATDDRLRMLTYAQAPVALPFGLEAHVKPCYNADGTEQLCFACNRYISRYRNTCPHEDCPSHADAT